VLVQAQEAVDQLSTAQVRCDQASVAEQSATDAVQEADRALTEAQGVADAVQLMLHTAQIQGLQSHAQELQSMAQQQENEIHRCMPCIDCPTHAAVPDRVRLGEYRTSADADTIKMIRARSQCDHRVIAS
jgi:hypothetical protein